MTTNIVVQRKETIVRPQPSGVVNVSVIPRTTTVLLSNEKGPQGPTGLTGNAGLVPVFTRQGNLYPVVGTQRFYVERSGTVEKIRVSVGTAPVGSAVVVDVLKNGSEVAVLAISSGTNTTVSSPSLSVSNGDYFTVNVSSVGSTTPGADLTVAITIN